MISFFIRNREWLRSLEDGLGIKPSVREVYSREAELRVARSLRRLGGEHWDVYHRVRVPNPDSIRGKGEIDVIAVGKRAVLAVEVKNWVGKVEIRDDVFLQRGSTRGRVIEGMGRKVNDLERLYRSATNRTVPPIFNLVVFPNPKTRLSDEVSRRQDCWPLSDLTVLHDRILSKESEMASQERDAFSNMFEEFGTWDTCVYSGGLEIEGDVADGFSICTEGDSEIDRESKSQISFHSTRGRLATFLLGPRMEAIIEGAGGHSHRCRIDPFSRFEFIPAGKRPLSIEASKISRISFGHRGFEGWRRMRNGNPQKNLEIGSSGGDEEDKDYKSGDVVTGSVHGWIEPGMLVELDRVGTTGLLHNWRFSSQQQLEISKLYYTHGREIEVRVVKTFPNGNINLDMVD